MGTSLGPKYIPYTCMDPLVTLNSTKKDRVSAKGCRNLRVQV